MISRERELEIMYQQWQQGNEDFRKEWLLFVRMAANSLRRDPKEIFGILQNTTWFYWDL